jgi:hypothetical protein
MKKIIYFSIFFLISAFVFASNETTLSPEAEKILQAILNLIQKNIVTSSVTVPGEIFEKREPVYSKEGKEPVQAEVKFQSIPKPLGQPFEQKTPDVRPQVSEVSQVALPVLPKNVKPAIPIEKPITPEVIKPILPDEDREDDAVVQINNLKITRIITSVPDAKGVIFAVRDIGWKCLFYESEESSVSKSCASDLRKSILQKELAIKIVDDTILLLRNRKRANIEDFQVGDKINVYGFMDKDNYGIEGLIIRNLTRNLPSSKLPVINKFTGYIISKEKMECPACAYNKPACEEPCKNVLSFFLSLKEDNKEYELIPQNDKVKEDIQKYADTKTLVTIEGSLKEDKVVFFEGVLSKYKILVDKVYSEKTKATLSPICIQVITQAQNPLTGECKEFSTPCDVPEGWKKVEKCPVSVVPPVQKIEEMRVEADDYGFYPSELTFSKGSKVVLTLAVRRSNVYYGGLDFRSEKFKTEPVKPGNATTVEFIADESFTITSYWPLSGVKKAELKIIVK